jgi:hypothetical protein
VDRKKLLIWGVLVLVIFVGLVVTVIDYREWRRLETQNFGQGWKDLKLDAQILDKDIVDNQLGIRYKVSSKLNVELKIREGIETEIGEKISQVEKPGGRGFVKYQAGKLTGEKIIVLETEVGEEDWGKWENTIKAIFESIQ